MVQNIRNLGGFFSDYYLGQLKESKLKGKLGENTFRQNFKQISKLYEKAELRLNSSSPKHEIIDRWIRPLLQILGFEENKNLFKNYLIETDKERLNVDFAFFPTENLSESNQNEINDLSPILFLDIYPWGTSLSQKLGRGYDNTPLKKMRNKIAFSNAKWGIILNGPMVWLLKQQEGLEEQSFLEIDMSSILEEFDTASFEIFWALFRADAFYPDGDNPCLIDLIDIESKQHAAAVGKFLKDSVYKALEIFIQGILEDSSNKGILENFDIGEIFNQALLFMYRLLFIFYAESLELLPISHDIYRENYSLESIQILIKDPNEKFNANRYYLWESLQALFKMLDSGIDNGDLQVTAFNGYLFSYKKTPILEQIKVNDKILQQVISLLSLTPPQKFRGRETISYKELGVTQLGAIYEGILEYEPKIAEEDLVVLKSEKNQIILPTKLVKENDKSKIVEQISKDKFYLSSWGGSRKTTGTYYTPEKITKFLVETALFPLVKNKSSEEILRIKILDPAMGSGAFLVAACNYLADCFLDKLIEEGKVQETTLTKNELANFRRLIAENCLYGVDLNPMAVELAKVSLWITTAADQKPLNFLDHRLAVGNSLIGSSLKDVEFLSNVVFNQKDKLKNKEEISSLKKRPKALDHWFGTAFNFKTELEKLLNYRGPEFLSSSDIDRLTIQNKIKCFNRLISKQSALSKLKLIFNIWCSSWYWDKESAFPTTSEYQNIVKTILKNDIRSKRTEPFLKDIEELSEKLRYFHWELEFPELFFSSNGKPNKNPGFDVIVFNPPWDIVKPSKNEFFSIYDPKFKTLRKKEFTDKRIKELIQNPEIAENWENYLKSFKNLSRFYKNSKKFANLGTGDINTYKLFLDQCYKLLKNGGNASLIIHAGIHMDQGCQNLRKMLFENTNLNFLYKFDNENKIFPDIGHTFKFDLLNFTKGLETEEFSAAFFKWGTLDYLDDIAKRSLQIPVKLIQDLSPDELTIMEFRNQRDIEITSKLYNNFPLAKDKFEDNWNIKFESEFHQTIHRSIINYEKKGWNLYDGRSFQQFNPYFTPIRAWIEPELAADKKKITLSEIINEENWSGVKLCVRAITNVSGRRTLIASLIPPKNFIVNSAIKVSLESKKHNPNKLKLFLCGIFNSFIMDYIIRFKILMNLNFFHLYHLPIPRIYEENIYFREIIPRVAFLNCCDETFTDFWKDIYDPSWVTIKKNLTINWSNNNYVNDPKERDILEAEINVLVAHLYSLTHEEFNIILESFPNINEERPEFIELNIEKFDEIKKYLKRKYN